MSDHPLGDAPIEARFHDQMNSIASALDSLFNGDTKGAEREVGFVLLTFAYGGDNRRCNFISNGANRKDMVVLFKEMIRRFEGQAEVKGTA